ncbi:MAG: hypothetical protein HY077_10315 [Elusimicrobia bacterium]|nr:hypothetical protein [Elusimicrobiota bacterium]
MIPKTAPGSALKLEERVRELSAQLKELEERTGAFQREAASGAHMIGQLEATLKVEEEARVKLAALVERQSAKLARWRKEAEAQRIRAEDLVNQLAARTAEAQRLEAAAARAESAADERVKKELEAERKKLREELRKAMETAEAVRREGIEALEQARSLKK